jgi:hypothetical protein
MPERQPSAPPVVGLAEVAALAGVSKTRATELVALPGFPVPTELAAGKVWWQSQVEAFLSSWRADPARRKGERLPSGWADAEAYVLARLREILGATVEAPAGNDRGWDACAVRPDGRRVLVQVKAMASRRSARGDFTVGRLATDPARAAGVVAFVDLTVERPWPVYLAGARTVAELAQARHARYQQARGEDPTRPGSWPAKISRRLLEQMGTREWWALLEADDPTRLPDPGPFVEQAERDAPQPRAARR